MAIVPKKPVAKIQFFEDHIAPWTTNATAIGTTTVEVTALQTKTVAARAAYDAQQVSQDVAKAATETLKQAVATMNLAGTAIIDQVRSQAKNVGPSVYPLAQIPAPATPSPVGAPGKPFGLKVQLEDNGALTLKWKCNNPVGSTGTLYQIWRKIGTGAFTYIGGAGTKSFVDDTVPMGAVGVTYQLQAVRSTSVGPWAQFNVNFGSTPAGPMIVTEASPVKIAA